jgi:hypothetical protein
MFVSFAWAPRVPLVKQELSILPEQPSSPPVFSLVRFVQSLVFCVVFCKSLLVYLYFSFGHCIVCPSDSRVLVTSFVFQTFSFTWIYIYIPPKMKMWFVLDLSDIFWRIRNDINHRYRPRTKRISAFVFDTVQDVDIYECRRDRRLTMLQYSPLITVYTWVNWQRNPRSHELSIVHFKTFWLVTVPNNI